jgi:hypothetical protein
VCHTSADIADHLFDALKHYQISGIQIAFFAAANATNNDKALQLRSDRVTLGPMTSRLRYTSHIFDLVCTAILFGVDVEALDDAQYDFSQSQDDSTSGMQAITSFETILKNGTEEQQHRTWQSKGPIGKLHNLVTHIKTTTSSPTSRPTMHV